GMGRCGVRAPADAVPLAAAIAGERGSLRFRGVCGYEGHCVDEPDRELRRREVAASAARLGAAVAAPRAEGFEVEVVSSGGTGTYDLIAAEPRVSELQAGSYLVMDEYHAQVSAEFEPALAVLASVISRHEDLIVLDAGRKAISSDLAPSRLLD